MAKDKIAKAFLAITKDKFTIDTIAEMIATKHLAEGDVVRLNGYYSAGDGANHIRKISKTNDGSGVQLANGLYANIFHSGEVNVSWFGAKGDGVTDDSESINLAHKDTNITIVYSSKTYVINGHYAPSWVNKFQNYGGIYLNDNQRVIFETGAKLVFTSDTGNAGSFFQSQGKENIELWNIYGIGNRTNVGEFGHGIILWTSNIGGTEVATLDEWSKNIKLYNCTFENMNGDSFYFSGVDGVYFENLKAIRNRRNGITINAGSNIIGKVYEAREINGASPEAGIDIETDFSGKGVKNVLIEDIEIHDCNAGIWNILTNAEYANIKLKNINIYNAKKSAFCRFYNNPNLGNKNSTVTWEDMTFWNTNCETSETKNLIYSLDSVRDRGFLNIRNLKLRNTVKIDGNLLYIANSNFQSLNLPNYTIINNIDSDSDLNLITFTGAEDRSKICFESDLKLTINNSLEKGFGVYKNSYDGFRMEDDFNSRVGGKYLVNTQDKVFWFFKEPIKSYFFLNAGVSQIGIRSNVGGALFLLPNKTTSTTPTISYDCSVIWDSSLNLFVVEQLGQNLSSDSSLDTPYHASNMQKLGILDSYHQYLTDLHEYEKQQNYQSDTGVMNLNIIQPPIIPTKVEEYAKEYNLV